MSWIVLTIIAIFLFAVVNIIDDNLMSHVFDHPHFAAIISGMMPAILLVPLTLIFPIDLPSWSVINLALLSGFILIFSLFFYFKSLKLDHPSVVVALYNLQAIFTALIAYFFLGERLAASEYLGFGLLLVASFGISLSNLKNFRPPKVLLLMVVAALLIAISNAINDYVYTQAPFWNSFIFFVIGNFIAAICILLFSKSGRKFPKKLIAIKKFFPIFILSEILSITAGFLYNKAISLGSVSLISVLFGLQPIFILLISFSLVPFFPRLFRQITAQTLIHKSLWISLMLVGLYFVSF